MNLVNQLCVKEDEPVAQRNEELLQLLLGCAGAAVNLIERSGIPAFSEPRNVCFRTAPSSLYGEVPSAAGIERVEFNTSPLVRRTFSRAKYAGLLPLACASRWRLYDLSHAPLMPKTSRIADFPGH